MCSQVDLAITYWRNLNVPLSSLLDDIEAIREDVLVMKGAMDMCISEAQLCKDGLDELIHRVQDDYSNPVRRAAETLYRFSMGLAFTNIKRPVFPASTVSTFGSKLHESDMCAQ